MKRMQTLYWLLWSWTWYYILVVINQLYKGFKLLDLVLIRANGIITMLLLEICDTEINLVSSECSYQIVIQCTQKI